MKATKRKRPRAIAGVHVKKRLFVEGFRLLRAMALGPLSKEDAASNLGIPRREWYRWLTVFREVGIALAVGSRRRRAGPPEKTYRLWSQDWARLVLATPLSRRRRRS